MNDVSPGDTLRLNRASVLGSRDYTLKSGEDAAGSNNVSGKKNYLDEKLFVCRAMVVGRHVYSQHRYTVLRIVELTVNDPSEVDLKKST